MNKNIKTESTTRPTRTTDSAKRSASTLTRKSSKTIIGAVCKKSQRKNIDAVHKKSPKKNVSVVNIRDSNSDEEFLPSSYGKSVGHAVASRITRSRKNQPISGSKSTQNAKRKRIITEKIYQISDSSDDESICFTNTTNIEQIDLCELENNTLTTGVKQISDNTSTNTADILDEIIKSKHMKGNDCYPSTSNTDVAFNVTDDMNDFLNNLLDSSKDLLDDNCLKTSRELNEETNKLLASSRELIEKTNNHTNLENSVIYICTDKDSMKQCAKNNMESMKPVCTNLSKQPEQQKIVQCPICLEILGNSPMSSTTCGHIFCTSCIQNCIKQLKHCPTCRKRLTTKMVHPIFLF